MVFNIHGHVMVPKMTTLLYVYCKKTHYNMVSLIKVSVSMDPKDSVIMRLSCIKVFYTVLPHLIFTVADQNT